MSVHEETYNYDKRGNLTHIYKDGQLVNQYYFGALNRLESAVNYESGLGATYAYNGIGNRVGKVEGKPIKPLLPNIKLDNMELNPTKQVDDIIDITRQYHNLLQRNEDDKHTGFTWDNNVLSGSAMEEVIYYFQDDLGSPIRVIGRGGRKQEVYGYNEFGHGVLKSQEEIQYKSQKVLQPFGFTGYQQDSITNTNFAEAREYHSEVARFVNEDITAGFIQYPFSMNRYTYCFNSPLILVDMDGAWPTVVIGAIAGAVIGGVGSVVLDVASGRDIDVTKALVSAGKGAVAGAVVGTGVGIVASGTSAVLGGGAVASSTSIVGTAASTPTWLVGIGAAAEATASMGGSIREQYKENNSWNNVNIDKVLISGMEGGLLGALNVSGLGRAGMGISNALISGTFSALQGDSIWEILGNAGWSGLGGLIGGSGIGGHDGLYFSQTLKNNKILKAILRGALESAWLDEGKRAALELYNRFFKNDKDAVACE